MKLITISRLCSVVCLLGFILLSEFNLLSAQNTTNLTVHDGLPTNVVRCIHQAKNGVLWIGTDAGLCSYDGRELVIFDQNDGLPNNLVWAITESDQGEIWIGCYGGGLVSYDGSKFTDCSKDIPSKSIRTLHCDNDLVHIGTDRHFMIYDGLEYVHSKDQFQTMKVLKNDTNIFVITRRKGIYKLVYGEEKRIDFSLDSCSYHGMLFGAINYYEDLLIFKNNGVKILKSDSLKYCSSNGQLFSSPSIAWNAAIANDSSVFLAQWGVSLKNGGLYKLQNNEISFVNREYGITSREISCLHYDKLNQILWVGSIQNGIYKVMLNNAITNPISLNNFDSKGILRMLKKDNEQYFYVKEKGIYSVAEKDGIQLLCAKEKFVDLIKLHPKWQKKILKSERHKRLLEEGLKNLTFYNAQLENEMIWLSTDHGLFRFNTRTKKLDHQYIAGSVFFKDESRLLFYRPYRFLEKYDNVFSGDKPYKFIENNAPRDVTKIIKYNNNIWYGSYSRGLIKQSGDDFISYLKNKQINEKYINHLKVWNDSVLVVSSGSGNIYGVIEENDSLNIIFKLLSGVNIDANQIYFLESFQNQLLIGTNKGLVIFNGEETSLINDEEGYFMRDVFSTLEVDDGVLISDKKSLIKLNVDKLSFKYQNELYAKSFHTIDSVYKENLSSLSTLTFPYNRNYFEIKFRFSNLINPSKDVFTYDLEKNNGDEWIREYNSFFDPNKLSVWCTNLKPGEYRLRLNAKNKFTKNEAHSVYYHFKIIPPFWKTAWFIISSILLLLVSTYLIGQYFLRKYKEREKINLRLSETRLEALKAQMNPHFTFNLMNSIQNFVLDKDVDKALLHVSNFSKLIRTTLDYSNQKTISLEEEIEFLTNYVDLQNMRFGDRAKFIINYPEEHVKDILIPPMIIQPLIENVFVHAFSSSIKNPILEVNIYAENPIVDAKTLYIDVKDNGVGKSDKKINTHLSKGLSIVQERLQLINSTNKTSIELKYVDLKDTDPNTSGTKVQLKVPMQLMTK